MFGQSGGKTSAIRMVMEEAALGAFVRERITWSEKRPPTIGGDDRGQASTQIQRKLRYIKKKKSKGLSTSKGRLPWRG